MRMGKVQGHSAVVNAKMAEPIEMPFWLRTQVGPGSPESPWVGVILAERRAHCKYRDFLPWAAQERLNRSICHLDCGLGWAEGSTSSVVFARWHQCALNTIESSMYVGDAACCKITWPCYYWVSFFRRAPADSLEMWRCLAVSVSALRQCLS